jgi:hypothetical protein
MVACLLVGCGIGVAAQQVIQGPDIEQFLAHAKITAIKDIGKGVTNPQKATMEQDGVTHFGVFKTIDEKPAIGQTQVGAVVESEFQDSWRTEVAAYELDKLIGIHLVPTTVERFYNAKTGSMQLWCDSILDEEKRQATKAMPPDAAAWNNQMSNLFLWDNLIYNVDRNPGNILITAEWRLIAIDHSRTFRPFGSLNNAKLLTRFSKSLLARLGDLKEADVKTHMGKYLTPFQITGIMKRRDAILALAKKLVAEKGEAAVLFP